MIAKILSKQSPRFTKKESAAFCFGGAIFNLWLMKYWRKGMESCDLPQSWKPDVLHPNIEKLLFGASLLLATVSLNFLSSNKILKYIGFGSGLLAIFIVTFFGFKGLSQRPKFDFAGLVLTTDILKSIGFTMILYYDYIEEVNNYN